MGVIKTTWGLVVITFLYTIYGSLQGQAKNWKFFTLIDTFMFFSQECGIYYQFVFSYYTMKMIVFSSFLYWTVECIKCNDTYDNTL